VRVQQRALPVLPQVLALQVRPVPLAPPLRVALQVQVALRVQAAHPVLRVNGKSFLDGTDKAPALNWNMGPEGTKSYALAFYDNTIIDAGGDTKNGYHWVAWNIPADVRATPEDMPGGDGGINGLEQTSPLDKGKFLGPCPSWNYCKSGDKEVHNYSFVVYAVGDGAVQGGNASERTQWLESNALDKDEINVISDAAPDCKAESKGKPIFELKCAKCHTTDEKRGTTFDQLKRSLGRGPMRNIQITDTEITDVVEYLK